MTPEEETAAASAAFHTALTTLGVQTLEEALVLWDSVAPTGAAAQAERWLEDAVAMVVARRAEARELTYAFYRLIRALQTGTTIALPTEVRPPESVSLSTLREEFADLVASVERDGIELTHERSQRVAEAERLGEATTVSATGADAQITVETINGLRDDENRIDAAVLKKLREELAEAGPDVMEALLEELDDTRPARDVDELRRAIHDKAGVTAAAVAEASAMNGGRSTVSSIRRRDDRVIGWVRVSRTGTPCPFCAMLLTRGFVTGSIYTSAEAGGGAGSVPPEDNPDLFHPNCRCYAVPIFTSEQFDNDPAFDLNRELAEAWKSVVRGSRDGQSAWSEYVKGRQAAENEESARAA